MSKRIILGTKGSEVGLWVSKPGRSADSSNPEDFLVNSSKELLRPMMSGVIVNPVLSADPNNYHTCTRNAAGASTVTQYDTAGAPWWALVGLVQPTTYEAWALIRDGVAGYYKDYFFRSDHGSLGYVPLTHISIGSNTAGDSYPTIYIDSTKIRLYHQEGWGASKNMARTEHQKYAWSNGWYAVKDGNGNYVKVYSYNWADAPKTSTKQFNCNIHYTVYEKAMSL